MRNSLSQPYLYDQSRRVVVTYDDPVSLALKGKLAAEKKIAGLIMVRSPSSSPSRRC